MPPRSVWKIRPSGAVPNSAMCSLKAAAQAPPQAGHLPVRGRIVGVGGGAWPTYVTSSGH
jgi:hypothetical protein